MTQAGRTRVHPRFDGKPLTSSDLLACGTPYDRCELWDGTPLVRDPSAGPAEEVASRIVTPLGRHVRSKRLGWVVLSNQGFLVARNPDRILVPDAAFVSYERLPKMPAKDFIPVAPDFAIEVKSAGEDWFGVIARAGYWITHRVEVVWCIDPETRQATVHRGYKNTEELEGKAVLDAAPVLPGFRVRLEDLFAGLM